MKDFGLKQEEEKTANKVRKINLIPRENKLIFLNPLTDIFSFFYV